MLQRFGLSFVLQLAAVFLGIAAVADAADWKMVWHDEFDKDGPPDAANWGYERGFVRNNELQYYQPENATCRGGLLVIEARREHKANPDYRPGGRGGWKNRQWIEYTSACLITRRKHEFTYGKFEMRARIDTRLGSWPAFWTLGTSRGWPACGEVDIMEYYTGKVLANVCYGGAPAQRVVKQNWTTTRKPLAELGGDAWTKQFHVWTMVWDKQQIDLLLDGKPMTHFRIKDDDEAAKAAFRQPHYILLNQAIGGSSGGDPAQTKFPVRMEVDWVRVYQKAAAED